MENLCRCKHCGENNIIMDENWLTKTTYIVYIGCDNWRCRKAEVTKRGRNPEKVRDKAVEAWNKLNRRA